MSGNHRAISTMPGQNTATDMASIEAISVVFAAVLVWLSALVQNLSNASERGAKYVMSDRSVSPPLQGFFGRATRAVDDRLSRYERFATTSPPRCALRRMDAIATNSNRRAYSADVLAA